MKIATGNRLNEFWKELKEVLVPKSKVLKTLEEIEANTNEENIAGATALKAVNNNFLMSRPEWITDSTGKITGYKTPGGADTVFPFINEGKIVDVIQQESNVFDLSKYSNFRYLFFADEVHQFNLDNIFAGQQHVSASTFCDKNLGFVLKSQGGYDVDKSGSTYTFSSIYKYRLCILIA